ncbi:MAG TPA: hypothetical protein VF761_02560 [Gemmatimonadaceae bacterium]
MRNLLPTWIALLAVFIVIISRRPIDILRRRGAVSPETAQPLDDISAADRRRLERLMAQGLVREASPGRYYFDRATERARFRQRAPWLLGLVVLLLLLAVVMFYLGRGVTPTA